MTHTYQEFYKYLTESTKKVPKRKYYHLLHVSDSGGEWGEMIKVKQLKKDDVYKAIRAILKKIPPSVYYDVNALAEEYTLNEAVEYIYDRTLDKFHVYDPEYEFEMTLTLDGSDVWSRNFIKQSLKKTGRF